MMQQNQIFFYKITAHIKRSGVLVVAFMPNHDVNMFVYRTDYAKACRKTDLQTGRISVITEENGTTEWYDRAICADVYCLDNVSVTGPTARNILQELKESQSFLGQLSVTLYCRPELEMRSAFSCPY
jgi:hypothetical protein